MDGLSNGVYNIYKCNQGHWGETVCQVQNQEQVQYQVQGHEKYG